MLWEKQDKAITRKLTDEIESNQYCRSDSSHGENLDALLRLHFPGKRKKENAFANFTKQLRDSKEQREKKNK